MQNFWKFVLIAELFLSSAIVCAGQVAIGKVEFATDATSTRMLFNVPSTVARDIFLLAHPARLVIDFKKAQLSGGLSQPPNNHPLFVRLRSAQRNGNDLRIVVDLKKSLFPKDLRVITDKNNGNGVLVAVLMANLPVEKIDKPEPVVTPEEIPVKTVESKVVAENTTEPVEVAEADTHKVVAKNITKKDKEIVVAVDAGHGGNDAGAHGINGTQEKRVVFAIAKRLAQLIDSQPGMRAVMVRKGDYYIKLRDRMEIAREAKADLFVSIHADAINDATVKGASVYTLSNTGASSEAARWLANSENAADLVGGVSLDDKDDVLASVLLDLSQSATKEASRSVAGKILKYFDAIGKLHKNEVQKAGFMVLKSPDIPSILIETAFISNPDEEAELRNVEHQDKIASAVFKGIASYFREYAPAGTRMASSQ